MQKTKLGISVGLMGAIAYFSGLFSGYLVAVLIFGYVMLFEDDAWLRKTATKSIALLIVFSLFSTVLGLIPDFISFINSVVFNIFGGYFSLPTITNIVAVITSAINIIKTVVFLILGFKALKQRTSNLPVVDNLLEKNME